MARRLFALIRSFAVAALFVSLWLYFLPLWLAGPSVFDVPHPAGLAVLAAGAGIDVVCFTHFALRGLGTPAPFDPPRSLVVSGPYRWVRNPMYTGMGIAMLGWALAFPNGSRIMLGEMAAAATLAWLFILLYEEPVLRRTFGADYEEYCRNVRRWIPRLTPWYPPG